LSLSEDHITAVTAPKLKSSPRSLHSSNINVWQKCLANKFDQ
jgi:hypothetical protein